MVTDDAAPLITPRRPTPAVSAAVFRGDSILLVKRAKPPFQGAWSLPGGKIELGETANEAIAREILEETALSFAPLGIAGVDDVIVRADDGAITHHYVIIVFAGSSDTGEPVAGDDASESAFVPLSALPDFGLGRRTLALIASAQDILNSPAVLSSQAAAST